MFGVVSVCVCVCAELGLQQDTLPSRGPVSGSWVGLDRYRAGLWPPQPPPSTTFQWLADY